jgi:hypothetical protein
LCITCGCHHLATACLCEVFLSINHLLTWGVLRTNTGLRNRKRSPPAAWRWVRLLRRILSWEEPYACHVIVPLCCQQHSRFDVTHHVSARIHACMRQELCVQHHQACVCTIAWMHIHRQRPFQGKKFFCTKQGCIICSSSKWCPVDEIHL